MMMNILNKYILFVASVKVMPYYLGRKAVSDRRGALLVHDKYANKALTHSRIPPSSMSMPILFTGAFTPFKCRGSHPLLL
jgi:hypothetical protein